MAPKSNGTSSSGAKPKRVRRKCSFPSCANRVVQGGVCVTHGAKRKLCSHPNCTKAVKLAGFCSTHGPARRKCDYLGQHGETCSRVAVQGGKCLSHGARRRVCSYPGGTCAKNAIVGGMCKKHYDRVRDAEGMLEMSYCLPVSAGNGIISGVNGGIGIGHANDAARGGLSGVMENGGQDLGGNESLSGGELSEDGSGNDNESQSHSVFSTPSWGSAPTIANCGSSAKAGIDHHGQGPVESVESVEQHDQIVDHHLAPSASVPDLPSMMAARNHDYAITTASSSRRFSDHRRAHKKAKQGHQRGLSIFDEMPTVNAIINGTRGANPDNDSNGKEEEANSGVIGGMQPVRCQPVPPRVPPRQIEYPPPRYPQTRTAPTSSSSSDITMSTETPKPQTSFVDGHVTNGILRRSSKSGAGGGGSSSSSPSACIGNASCTCNACRSPTLAIFEQMIVASQKLEAGDVNNNFDPREFEGLSPPNLGDAVRGGGGTTIDTMGTTSLATPRSANKKVSFLPEEPNSSGSVVRKVSSNNIVGEESWENAAPREEGGAYVGYAEYPLPRGAPREDRDHYYQDPQGQREGPASHALAVMRRDDNGVSRTVSHDVDDGRHATTYGRYPPQGHPPHFQHPPQAPRRHGDINPHHGYSSYPYREQRHDRQGRRHDNDHSSSRRPHRGHRQSHRHHRAAPAPPAFHPPQTPALYDQDYDAPTYTPTMSTNSAVVSTHERNTHHCEQLLPKPRENRAFEHLFIPKEA